MLDPCIGCWRGLARYPIGAFSYSHALKRRSRRFIKDGRRWLAGFRPSDRTALAGRRRLVCRGVAGADAKGWKTFRPPSPSARAHGAAHRRWRWSRAAGWLVPVITKNAWKHPDRFGARTLSGEIALPVAVGSAAVHGMRWKCVERLSPCLPPQPDSRQCLPCRRSTDGQLALAALEAYVNQTTRAAIAAQSLTSARPPAARLCSLKHETHIRGSSAHDLPVASRSSRALAAAHAVGAAGSGRRRRTGLAHA